MPVRMQAAESSIELTEDIQSGPPVWFKWVRPFTRSKWTLYGVVVLLRCACTSVPAIAGPPTGAEEADFGPCFPEDILPGKVVGGEEAKPNAWPWQVSLQMRCCGDKSYHFCGAVLLGTRWAMTAAHCVDGGYNEFLAVVGEHDLDIESGREQVVNISKVHIHPLFNWNPFIGYDIALLEFDSDVTLNQFVQPAALPPAGQILPHNHTCNITGWGRTKEAGGGLSTRLKQAFLPVVDHETCSRPDWWGDKVKSNMICAGGNGVDSGCHGDSGGPLNCEVNGNYVVHGVVSWGSPECNVPKKASVFTRVSDFIEWFNSIMN